MTKRASPKITASFVDPMLALSASSFPEGPEWEYELKLDGYRALAIKTGGQVQLRSRNDKDFGGRFPRHCRGFSSDAQRNCYRRRSSSPGRFRQTVVQYAPELCRWSPNLLLRFRFADSPRPRSAFKAINERRELLRFEVLSKLDEPIRYSPTLNGSLAI